jgi:integrating conjugative element protein (TIGR03752 family)
MATKLGSSPILRLGTWGVGIVLAFMFVSWLLNDDELPQGDVTKQQSTSAQSLKDAEAAENEKGALANDVKQLFARFDQVNKQNQDLAEQLQKFGKGLSGQSNVTTTQQLTADDIEALITKEVNRRMAAQSSSPELLEGSTSMNVGQSTEDALSAFESGGGAGVGLSGYVVGGNSKATKDDETVEWLLPQDAPVEGGKTVFDGFFDKASEQLDFASDGTLNGGGNKKKTSIQYATIDKDAILYKAMVLNDLIGVVASGDTVQAPFKFKLEVSQENLATSGLYMPHVAMMRLSGYSRGEWATGCVEGIVTGATFVFEDGTISEISTGEDGKEGGNGNQIGYLSDIHGSPCIKGKKYSDLMEYAGVSGGLTALAAAGDALASAQYSVQKSPDNVMQTFDGSLLSNAVGQGASQGINSINQVIATRYANVRDLVVAPAGQYVVMLSQQINIDYNPEGRKILNENFEEELEAYRANKQSVVNP